MAFLPPWQELTPDYSMESHQRDHENYVACSRGHPRRAKALLDFERHDDDELGFRKNDIITVCGERAPSLGSGWGGQALAWPELRPRTKPGSQSRASHNFPWQIVSQKDEHCWVGELNGLRGEASVWSVSCWAGGRAGQAARLRRCGGCAQCLCRPVSSVPSGVGELRTQSRAPHGLCFSPRLVSSQVRGSPG